ncbi:uncharacterized protein [Panulirus ornatus]|uniref:uncharacterized protein n=1 Tax=Panulirus ornatus TaxID=150431 RepID=UPI003A835994
MLVDYTGPLFCVDYPCKKLYILLFTCGVVRAVHLELTNSMSYDDCLLAFRRFSARRGLPSVIYSDNAKTFISMSKQMHQFFGTLAPQWKFVVPHACANSRPLTFATDDPNSVSLLTPHFLIGRTVIVELFPGKNGIIRSVKVKTAKGVGAQISCA